MKANSKPRIFLGICDIAGFMDSLNKGFHKINVSSDFYDLSHNRFRYSDVKQSGFVRLHRYLSEKEFSSSSKLIRYGYAFMEIIMRLFLFIKCVFYYDVFIFCSTRSLLAFYDLPVLKFFNKKIIFVFLGTDTRPAYSSGNIVKRNVLRNGTIENLEALIDDSRIKRKILKRIEKYADFLINNPPTSLFHSRPIVLFSILGFPFCDGKIKDIQSAENEGPAVKILHAPSDPEIKGSIIIKSIIEKLKAKGHNLDYVEITNRTNREVLEEIANCDFVIDELYADVPLGGLGTEAAFLGKPTINAGYYSGLFNDDFPETAIPPSIYCTPENLEEAIENLVKDPGLRRSIGLKSREFVYTNYESGIVAAKYLELIMNRYPGNWLFNPSQNRYIFGAGQSVDQLRSVVKALLHNFGNQALFLDDKPALLKAFRNFTDEN